MQKLTQHTAFQTVSIIQFTNIIYHYSAEINIKSVTTEPKKPSAFCTNTAKISLIVPIHPKHLGIGELSAYRLAKPQSRETQLIARMKDIIEPAYEIYVRGYTNAARNLRNMEGGRQSNTKMQSRGNAYTEYDKPVNRSDIDTLHDIGRTKGKLSVNQFTSNEIQATQKWAYKFYQQLGVKSPFFRAWFGDWRANEKTPVMVAKDKGAKRGAARNIDTGWNINVSGKVFNETSAHTEDYNIKARPYLPYINDIIEKAVLLDTVVSNKYDTQDSLFMHSFYAVADIGNGKELLKLYVEEMNNANSSDDTQRAYQLQNIEKQKLSAKGSQNTSVSPVVSASDVKTISDLFALVKRNDYRFKPNSASKVVDSDGKPLVVYHGTGKDFTVFDNGRFGTNYDGWGELGRGFYATDNKKTAKQYAERSKGDLSKIMEGYIDIKKPLYVYEALPDEIDLSSLIEKYNIPYWIADGMKRNAGQMIDVLIENGEDVQSFLKQFGYDGIIEMSGKGDMYQIVFFDSSQFKSATDNIGTFDRSNPDIRYQQRSEGYDFGDFVAEFGEEIEDTLAREFETHHEDIGEVLRNTADIEITAAKVNSIVNRIIKNNLGEIDSIFRIQRPSFLCLKSSPNQYLHPYKSSAVYCKGTRRS